MSNLRRSMLSAVTASLIVAATGWVSAQSDGIKDTERFVKSGTSMSEAVAGARLSAQTALDAHNLLIMGTSSNMKGEYKKLVYAADVMAKKVADAKKMAAEMDKQSAAYFTSRLAALGQIEDPKLRDLAKTRLEASQKEYEAIKVQLRAASDSLAPFAKSLNDQIRYLGAELTPGAADSLATEATTLTDRGHDVFAQADAAVNAANLYFNALRPNRARPAPVPAATSEATVQQQ
jgi:hypothetical protein